MSEIIERTQAAVDVKYPEAPDYAIKSDQDPVLVGMHYTINPDILGNRFNTVDIDMNSKDAVDALYAKYPEAWVDMYKDGEPYTYSAQNAYKLKRAVELYMWLHPEEFGVSNVTFSEDIGELETTTPDPTTYKVQVPYSQFMTDPAWGEYRIPLDTLYSKDFLNDVSHEAPITHYYDSHGLAVEIIGVEITDTQPNDAYSVPFSFKAADGSVVVRYVKYITDDGGYAPVTLPLFTPYLMESVRRVRSMLTSGFAHPLVKPVSEQFVDGEGWRGFSEEYLNKRSHQVFHTSPKSPYDAGAEFSAGRYGFPN